MRKSAKWVVVAAAIGAAVAGWSMARGRGQGRIPLHADPDPQLSVRATSPAPGTVDLRADFGHVNHVRDATYWWYVDVRREVVPGRFKTLWDYHYDQELFAARRHKPLTRKFRDVLDLEAGRYRILLGVREDVNVYSRDGDVLEAGPLVLSRSVIVTVK